MLLIMISAIIAIVIGVYSGSFLLGLIVFIFGLSSMGNSTAHKARKRRREGDPDYIYYDDL